VRSFLWLGFRAWLIVTCTAANVAFISHGAFWAMGVTGYAISWVWVGNTQAAVRFDRRGAREVYALGAMLGTWTGWCLASWLREVL
jgi:hypothetical protein